VIIIKASESIWNLFLRGKFQAFLQLPPVKTGGFRERLFSMETIPFTGVRLKISILGTHNREKYLRYLVLKNLLGTLTVPEGDLLRILGAISSNWYLLLVDFLNKFRIQLKEDHQLRKWFLRFLEGIPELQMKEPQRILKSYTPQYRIEVKRISRKKINFPSTMGVGYKDRGSLPKNPRIEIRGNFEETQNDSQLNVFQNMLETLSNLLLSQSPKNLDKKSR